MRTKIGPPRASMHISCMGWADCMMQSTTSRSRAGYPESENPDPISQTPDFRIESVPKPPERSLAKSQMQPQAGRLT